MKNPLWTQPGLDRLICVTICSVGLFLVQIVMSHISHSLALLAAAYHMLYNIMSLIGCVATIKMCQRGSSVSNTFGWARLEVLSTVINLLFLCALDFSLVVESVQTLIHSDHMDSMHRPDIICIVAGLGIALNGVCVILIGGYTHHQGSFLALTETGDVVVQHGSATEDAVRQGLRRLSSQRRIDDGRLRTMEETEEDAMMMATKGDISSKENVKRVSQRWPTMYSIFRDNTSNVIALTSAVVVYTNGESFVSLIIDPLLTIVSVAILAVTSFPFMVQAGKILLQTTPAHIDVAELKTKLQRAFPSVVNIHDLHVWELTPRRVISTAHLVFMNESAYLEAKEPINLFFLDLGITRITLQPEFYKFGNLTPAQSKSCVLTCNKDDCKSMTCCNYQHANLLVVEEVESPASNHENCIQTSLDCRTVIIVEHSDVSSVADMFVEDISLTLDQDNNGKLKEPPQYSNTSIPAPTDEPREDQLLLDNEIHSEKILDLPD